MMDEDTREVFRLMQVQSRIVQDRIDSVRTKLLYTQINTRLALLLLGFLIGRGL